MAVTMATACAVGRVIPTKVGVKPAYVTNTITNTPPATGSLPTFYDGKKDTGRKKYENQQH